jgi:hypothetical protein
MENRDIYSMHVHFEHRGIISAISRVDVDRDGDSSRLLTAEDERTARVMNAIQRYENSR